MDQNYTKATNDCFVLDLAAQRELCVFEMQAEVTGHYHFFLT